MLVFNESGTRVRYPRFCWGDVEMPVIQSPKKLHDLPKHLFFSWSEAIVFSMRMVAIGCCFGLQLSLFVAPSIAQVRDASIEELIKQSESKESESRRDAIYELVRRGDTSEPVIVALGTATNDDDAQIRVQALTGLARAGNKSEVVIPQLIKCLSNREDQVRFRAAAALGAIGNAAITPIAEQWEKASTDSKIAAAQALAIIGPEASSTIALLTDGLEGKDKLPRYVAEALVAISPQDETTMLRIAEHSNPAARIVGISALAALGSPSDVAMKKLQAAASDSESKIRETAIVAVSKSSLPIAEKSTLIEAALVDSEASVRAAAIVAMRKAKLPSAEFANRIASRLMNTEGEAANALVKAIGGLGRDAAGTLPVLLQTLGRDGIDLQLVSQSLASFGAPVVPDLLAAIEKQPESEPELSRALALIGEPAVESLVRGMSSEVELIRVAATRAIGGVRPTNRSLLEHLLRAASDKAAEVREIAVKSLVATGIEADFAKDTLLKATEDAEGKVRVAAIGSLATLKYNEDQMQAALERGLSDPVAEVRVATLQALSEMPKLIKLRLPKLVALVDDTDSGVRTMALQTLGKLDKKNVDEAVVKACAEALGDEVYLVRIAATETVKTLGISDPAVLTALSNNLIDDLALLRVTLEAISGFGEKAAALIPAVSQLAAHEKAELRVAALGALAAIEKNHEQLTGRLTEALDDKEWDVRRTAGVALGKLGPDAKNAVPKLFKLLENDEDRDFASGALKEINAAPVEAIPLLIEKLDSEERRTAFYAVSLLGKIGPPAIEALPKLQAMLEKPSTDGRSEFRKKSLNETIAAIKGETKSDKDK